MLSTQIGEKHGAPPTLLIGANIRFLAENAAQHGHNIYIVDYYGDWDIENICENRSAKRDGDSSFDLKSLTSLAHGIENSGVVYGPGFENDIFAVSRLMEIGEVIGCGHDTVRRSRDPEALASAARSWNFKYPPVRYEKDASMKRGGWLTKPFSSMGGVNIRFVDDKEEVAAEGGVYYQKYVKGLPSSAMLVSNGSETAVLGVMTQIIGDADYGASGFRYVGNVFPHPFAKELSGQVAAIAESLTLDLNLKGLWGFDFVYDGDVNLVEINPRPSAGLGVLAQATLNDLLGLHIESIGNENSNLIIDPGDMGKYFAQARVFAKEDVIFADPEKWFEMGARDIPHDGELIVAGDPVLTVFSSDTSYKRALVKLHDKAERVYDHLHQATAKSL